MRIYFSLMRQEIVLIFFLGSIVGIMKYIRIEATGPDRSFRFSYIDFQFVCISLWSRLKVMV